jgi:pimeloyl-ACP methyl ester carboxylesterase
MFESVLNGIGTDEQLTVETSAKPLCVVQGEREPFVRIDYLSSLLYASLYGGHIHVLRGAGHAPHWQLPIDFNAILLRFLSERARAVVPNCDPEQLRLRVANMSV